MIHDLRIPIWAEARFALERAALHRHPVFRGDGGPVLLVPGFLAGDSSLGLMAHEALGARCAAAPRAQPCSTAA